MMIKPGSFGLFKTLPVLEESPDLLVPSRRDEVASELVE
jgi:hypothetical protein